MAGTLGPETSAQGPSLQVMPHQQVQGRPSCVQPLRPSSPVPTVQKSTPFIRLRPDLENKARFYSLEYYTHLRGLEGAAAQSQGRGRGAEGSDVL